MFTSIESNEWMNDAMVPLFLTYFEFSDRDLMLLCALVENDLLPDFRSRWQVVMVRSGPVRSGQARVMMVCCSGVLCLRYAAYGPFPRTVSPYIRIVPNDKLALKTYRTNSMLPNPAISHTVLRPVSNQHVSEVFCSLTRHN